MTLSVPKQAWQQRAPTVSQAAAAYPAGSGPTSAEGSCSRPCALHWQLGTLQARGHLLSGLWACLVVPHWHAAVPGYVWPHQSFLHWLLSKFGTHAVNAGMPSVLSFVSRPDKRLHMLAQQDSLAEPGCPAEHLGMLLRHCNPCSRVQLRQVAVKQTSAHDCTYGLHNCYAVPYYILRSRRPYDALMCRGWICTARWCGVVTCEVWRL